MPGLTTQPPVERGSRLPPPQARSALCSIVRPAHLHPMYMQSGVESRSTSTDTRRSPAQHTHVQIIPQRPPRRYSTLHYALSLQR